MAIIKWSPAREIASLQQGINRLFEDVFAQPGSYDADAMGAWRPAVDIVDTQEAILIFVEIPGVDKEEVAIEVKDNVLSIQGERVVDSCIGNGSYYRSERVFGKFGPLLCPADHGAHRKHQGQFQERRAQNHHPQAGRRKAASGQHQCGIAAP